MDKTEIFDKDYKIFNIILRLLKDYNILKVDDIGKIVERCYKSRQSHQGENYLTNASYWLNDSNILSYVSSNIIKMIIKFIYIIRLINLFDTYERSPCITKINEYINYFVKHDFFDRIYNYHENEIKQALDKISNIINDTKLINNTEKTNFLFVKELVLNNNKKNG